MTRRHEQPLLPEEKTAIRQMSRAGMSTGSIAVALFVSKRQVAYTLAHPDDEGEAVTV